MCVLPSFTYNVLLRSYKEFVSLSVFWVNQRTHKIKVVPLFPSKLHFKKLRYMVHLE